jgi:hypothetical protein
MVKQPDIDEVLAFVLRDPKNTTDFLLGTICTKVSNVEDRQTLIIKDQDEFKEEVRKDIAEIKRKNAFNKGFIAAITTIAGSVGVGLVYFLKWLGGFIITTH